MSFGKKLHVPSFFALFSIIAAESGFGNGLCYALGVLERDIQRACLEWLAAKRIFVWRQNQGAIPWAKVVCSRWKSKARRGDPGPKQREFLDNETLAAASDCASSGRAGRGHKPVP
jgi:hypothetical protein